MVNPRRLIAMLVALCTISCAHATDYYLDSERGSDEAAGTSPQEAWASLDRLAQVTLEPGDRALLRRGSTFRGRLQVDGSGTEQAPIIVGAWGEGNKPEILGTVEIDGWEQAGGEVWQATVPEALFRGQKNVFSVYEYDDVIPVRLERVDATPTERATYHFDPETMVLSVITTDGRSPAEHRFEVPVIEKLIDLRDQRRIVFEDLALLMGNCRHVVISGCEDVIFRNCASLFVGAYGNPNFILRDTCRRVQILDCFLYENVNGGVLLTSGTTECRIAGCTIERCRSNDGITCHAGARVDGVRTGLTGDRNVIENNVIGHCPEESIDITSGDYHVLRGNICHDDGNPGIIIGHDADHILVERNICLRSRGGIYVGGNPEEGAEGHDRVIGNLCYENTYPAVEVHSPDAEVIGNTLLNSLERVVVRVAPEAMRAVIRDNIIANLNPTIPHKLIHFIRCTPESVSAELRNNLLFHAADLRKQEVFFAEGELIRTDDGGFNVESFRERYDTGEDTTVADPQFASTEDGYFRLSAEGPAEGLGAPVSALPDYPPHLIDGSEVDRAEILRLWEKEG
jgi:hypothetical protein